MLLWDDWAELKGKIFSKEKILLLLDFDGTLSPIAKYPYTATLPRKALNAIKKLSHNPSYRIAIVSGRPLKNLRSYFGMKGLIYVGNHGFEIDHKGAKGLAFLEAVKKAKKIKPIIWLLSKKLKELFRDMTDILIEDKGYTLSLHFRDLSKKHGALFAERFALIRREFSHCPIVWKKEKKVWEARPDVDWNKGKAALCLSQKFSGSFQIAIGDSRTDEDMFQVITRSGLAIRVGHCRKSAASHYLKSPYDVIRFLEELCR